MEIPIYIDDREEGALSIAREGALTVLEARLRDVGRLVRLTVYGPGGEMYLGVPVPQEDGLYLRKRLTRSELRALPQRPEYAAERRLAKEAPPASAAERRHVIWQGGRPHYF